VLPPSDPNTSRDSVATQVLSLSPPIQLPPAAAERPLNKPSADDGGSSARGGSTASAGSGVTQFATSPAPTAARVANPTGAAVPEQPSSMRPADAPAPRRAAARPEPESTPSRTIPAPGARPAPVVVPPPTRPSDPRTEESRGSDPGAIIDWLVQERPRIVE
jgi:hypothetical protein